MNNLYNYMFDSYKEIDDICNRIYNELIDLGLEKEVARKYVENMLNDVINKTFNF